MTGSLPAAERRVIRSSTSPCPSCPWRASLQGTRTPGGWYSKANLRRLWRGLRAGERMTCHPTDPRMAEPEMIEQAYDGFRPAPETAETLECAGSLIVALREVYHLQEEHGSDVRAYRRARPRGLTREGVASLVARLLFSGFDTTRFNLNEPDVAHPDLPWRDA